MAKAYEEDNGNCNINNTDRRDPKLFVFTTEPDAWQSRLARRAWILESALREAVRLYETYGLLAQNSECGKWINDARKALAEQEGKGIKKAP